MQVIRGDGELYLIHGGECWSLTVDDVRRMYYVVLGMDPPLSTLRAEIEALRKWSIVSVDEPGDILKAERVMELNDV